jgi:hypothetical protein
VGEGIGTQLVKKTLVESVISSRGNAPAIPAAGIPAFLPLAGPGALSFRDSSEFSGGREIFFYSRIVVCFIRKNSFFC